MRLAKPLSFLLLSLFFFFLSGCKKPEAKRFSFTNPMDSCKSVQRTLTKVVHDSINDINFDLGEEWKLHFNHRLKITECIDTVAFDNYRELRTFTVNTVASELPLFDFFSDEVKAMYRDSVEVLYLGERFIDSRQALYAIATTKYNGMDINCAFFYLKKDGHVIIMQTGVSASQNPVQKLCPSMAILNTVNLLPKDKRQS